MTKATVERNVNSALENEFIPPIHLPEATADVAWEQRLNAEVAWQLASGTMDGGGRTPGDSGEEPAERRLPTMRSITRMNTILVALRERLYQVQTEAANVAIGELALRQESTPGAPPDDAFSPLHEQNVQRVEALAKSCLELLTSAQANLAALCGMAPGRLGSVDVGLEDSLRVDRRRHTTVIAFPDRRAAA